MTHPRMHEGVVDLADVRLLPWPSPPRLGYTPNNETKNKRALKRGAGVSMLMHNVTINPVSCILFQRPKS
jgi:hypothetical protein